jgi:hypothetical protein
MQGEPNLVLGPSVAGFIGSLPIALVALAILLSPRALRPNEVGSPSAAKDNISVASSENRPVAG